jgi:hypothetical protein
MSIIKGECKHNKGGWIREEAQPEGLLGLLWIPGIRSSPYWEEALKHPQEIYPSPGSRKFMFMETSPI